MALGVLAVVSITTFLWLKYLGSLDLYRRDKRTTRMIAVGIVVGILSGELTVLLYRLNPLAGLEHFIGEFLYNFFVVGMTEEIAKYLSFIAMVLACRSLKEPKDGIIQGAAVGLGFQAAEDIVYGMHWGVEVAFIRSVYAGLHMLCGALWGYAFSSAYFANLEGPDNRSVALAMLAVIPAALFHGLYNSVIGVGSWTGTGPAMEFVIVLVLLAFAVRAFRRMVERSPYRFYPYTDYSLAIPNIRRGLLLNPGSVILNRRMALYLMAAGRYRAALKHLRICKRRVKKHTMYEALEAIAILGVSAQHGETEQQIAARARQMLAAARAKLDAEGRTLPLSNQLHRFVRDEELLEEVRRILLPPRERLTGRRIEFEETR